MSRPPPLPIPPSEGASPAMAQWFGLKERHPDALLFFRMGDFYELFFADAEAAAAALDIALTARGTHGGQPIPMCGVPVHAAQSYLARLIRRGFRVAVAEQTEPSRKPGSGGGKAPLARDVVRLVTAGTLFEDELLDAGRPNLLLALHAPAGRGAGRAGTAAAVGAAWIDVSTGAFETALLDGPGAVSELLGRLEPAEILVSGAIALGEHEARRGPDAAAPPPDAARARLAAGFGVASLDAFGAFSDPEAVAAAIVRDYARDAQAGREPVLSRPVPGAATDRLGIDPATRTSLDLLRDRDGGTRHSLFGAVDRTVSGAGGRMLAGWIAAPLAVAAAIEERQDSWEHLAARPDTGGTLRTVLRG
ncbi:MAG: DNA mismatch repair protein MutS, partial [Gluconacetobacter diazotrophicus]|nr:DNA mismatch repair protein MutS [Gluconacetobacter diazotrophicus]